MMMMQTMLKEMMRCAAAVKGMLVNTATACIAAVDTIGVQEQQQPGAAGPATPVLAAPLYETSPLAVGLRSASRMQ
jgi:hypothetical protein